MVAGSDVTAAAWTTAGIILESTGYHPIDLTDTGDTLQFDKKPTDLYSWTSSQYYVDSQLTTPLTIYTDTQTPQAGDLLYDKNGNIYTDYIECYDSIDFYGLNACIVSFENNVLTIGTPTPTPAMPVTE